MATIREEVLAGIKKAKSHRTRWYHWFNNFLLYTKPGRINCGIEEYCKENPDVLDKPFNDRKTHREFYLDVDQAFRDTGNYDLMMKRTQEKLDAENANPKKECIQEEINLAETYIEPFIRLREMGYTHAELI